MAYKFQKGSAFLSGSVIMDDSGFSTTDNITAQVLHADTAGGGDGDLIVQGDANVNNKIAFAANSVATAGLYLSNGTASGSLRAYASNSDFVGQGKLINDASAVIHHFGATAETTKANEGDTALAGFYVQKRASDGAIRAQIKGDNGDSTFQSLSVEGKGNSTITGDLIITGNLTVNGTLVDAQTGDYLLATDAAQIGNTTSALLGDSQNTGFQVNDAGSSGGSIRYVNNSGTRSLKFGNYNSAGLIDVRATKFYGNGAGITNLTVNNVSYSGVNLKGSGDDLQAGINYVTTIGGSGITVNLPAVSGLAVGDIMVVKDISGICADNKTITIDPNGSELADGNAASIVLKSPYASVGFIVQKKTGGGAGWSIF